jgi:hypothetical protein
MKRITSFLLGFSILPSLILISYLIYHFNLEWLIAPAVILVGSIGMGLIVAFPLWPGMNK